MKKVYILLLTIIVGNSLLNAQLIIYQNLNQAGNSANCVSNTIFKGINIPGGLNNGIKSITLSQGYMATLAENENGTGEGFSYIASVSNLSVNLAFKLQDKVSFIRVLPIKNVKKKGACTISNTLPDSLNVTWFYDWGPNDTSDVNMEYVPMTWGAGAVTEPKIDTLINKPKITSLLSFNEPDNASQSNVAFTTAVPLFKKVLRSGYRLGSPATTEGEYDNWLLNFMNLANQDTVRVDYIAVHWYDWGNWLSNGNPSPNANDVLNRFKSYITDVYNLYKKPIWITEFNCNPNRTAQTHANFMSLAMPWLDSDPRVERYAYFFPAAVPANVNGVLTTVGQIYTNHVSTAANPTNVFDTRSAYPEIVSWDASTLTGGGQSVTNYMPTSIVPNLTAVNGLRRGVGTSLSASSNENGYWGTNGFARLSAAHGIDSNKILTFELQSTNGKYVSYKTIDSFRIRIAATGPIKYQIDYKINSGVFLPVDTITGPTRTTGNYSLGPINLSGIAGLQNVPPTSKVTFRITPYDCTGNGVFYIGSGTGSIGSDLSFTGSVFDNIPIPINLSAFRSQRINDKVKLTWETQSEINFSHFLLERSSDSYNYNVIAKINSAGIYSGSKYSYEDFPTYFEPKYFYRLKMVDTDGKFTYSRILVEYFDRKKALSVFPAIVSGNQLTVLFDKVSSNAEMKIFGMDGKLIQSFRLKEGSGYEIIDLSNLSSGMFILVLQDTDGVLRSKFIKQ